MLEPQVPWSTVVLMIPQEPEELACSARVSARRCCFHHFDFSTGLPEILYPSIWLKQWPRFEHACASGLIQAVLNGT